MSVLVTAHHSPKQVNESLMTVNQLDLGFWSVLKQLHSWLSRQNKLVWTIEPRGFMLVTL